MPRIRNTLANPNSTYTALGDVQAVTTTAGALVAGKHNPVDATGASKAMTLADAASAGQVTSIEKTDSSVNTVTVTLNLRGTPASTLTLYWQNESIRLLSKADGSWWPVSGHKTKTSLDAAYVALGSATKQKIGDGGDPNNSVTQNVKLLVSAARNNPSNTIEQHFVGYSFYTGTPGASVGTLQGGSCESYAYANGTTDMGAVLGFEAIGHGSGDPGRAVSTIIGGQGTGLAEGSITVNLLVGLRARGISGSGTPTVTEARSLDVQEPLIGTTKRSIFCVGTVHLKKGANTNTLELTTTSDLLTWTFANQVLTGFASDGAASRLILDSQDAPTAGRVTSKLFGSGKHVSYLNNGTEVYAIAADGTVTMGGATTTTAPSAGAGGALPATPAGYVSIVIGGSTRKVAYY